MEFIPSCVCDGLGREERVWSVWWRERENKSGSCQVGSIWDLS